MTVKGTIVTLLYMLMGKITRRSRNGVLIMINKAPIMWYSKRQNTVKTSTYGSELVAMRLAVEMIKALKYKLRMFGIEILEDETIRSLVTIIL